MEGVALSLHIKTKAQRVVTCLKSHRFQEVQTALEFGAESNILLTRIYGQILTTRIKSEN